MAWHRRFQIHGGGGLALDVVAGGGVLLMAGHAGDGVVQNDNDGIALVVGDVYQAGDAGMDKGGIADDSHASSSPPRSPRRLVEAVEGGDQTRPCRWQVSMAFSGALAPKV